MDVLQSTLPQFFSTGLVSTAFHLPIGHIHTLLDVNGKGKGKAIDPGQPEEEGIYSRHVRLEYNPPVALPSPFPRVFTIEGE